MTVLPPSMSEKDRTATTRGSHFIAIPQRIKRSAWTHVYIMLVTARVGLETEKEKSTLCAFVSPRMRSENYGCK